jgi:hypothetical protein
MALTKLPCATALASDHCKKLNQFLTVCKGHHGKLMTFRKQQKSFLELEKPASLRCSHTSNAGNVTPFQASVSFSCFFFT